MRARRFLWISLLLVASIAHADNKVKLKIGEPAVPDGKSDTMFLSLYLVNQADHPLRFGLSENGNEWRNFRLKPGEGGNAHSESSGVKELSIRLRTGRDAFTTTLQFGRRYRLFWNADNNRWDVAQLEPQGGD